MSNDTDYSHLWITTLAEPVVPELSIKIERINLSTVYASWSIKGVLPVFIDHTLAGFSNYTRKFNLVADCDGFLSRKLPLGLNFHIYQELKFNVRVVGIGSRSALLELVDVCNRSNVQLQPNTFYMVKVFGINGYKTLYSSYFNFTPNNVNITGLKAYQYDNSQFVIEYASRQNNNSQTFYTVLVNDTIYCQQDTTPKPCFVVTSLPDSIDQQTITLNTTILKVLKPQQTLAITSSSSSSSLSFHCECLLEESHTSPVG
ncbi:hypothetical protein DFA_10577 [Cavenderia fasciculata]|uniref:Uncharacterized protein n=1 Tax=Cavenderia fasciculata TaxID=261658 RepID=F4QAL6_CACFS|nr:uncharacterized protein DFA_10577 [Cavenderia fasciculata]EGG15735.1 hypothetical protein DFA_10577 [Cavenderia fasciculata]|eukprot:XP_004366114.1 hypothetical protein DFA_10577 [Cavenderia fasciculata]